MLNKIILLNSAKYQKAVITLDVDSIQIVGGNNVGKTTLINVLNFLYMPNKRDWNFSHDTQETLRYYFKNLDKNYIIFEIFKDGYFCVLMRRSESSKLDYYKIDLAYDEIEQHFFQRKDDKKILLGFEEIQTNLLEHIYKLSDKDYRTLLYGESKRDKTILWLKKDKQSIFGKIYKYLLNINLITNDAVKESLLIADGKENISREFSSNDNNKIENMQQKLKEVNRLKTNKKDFETFKAIYMTYMAKSEILKNMYSNFIALYTQTTQKLDDEKNKIEQEIETIDEKVTQPLEKEKDELNKKIVSFEKDIEHTQIKINQKQGTIGNIESYDPVAFLQSNLATHEQKEEYLTYSLAKIKQEKYTEVSIKEDIERFKFKHKKFKEEIKNYENLLMHHISDNPKIQQKINTLFSKDLLMLDKIAVFHKISNDKDGFLEVFDGVIDVKAIPEKEYITLESLQKELNSTEQKLEQAEKILSDILNFQELQKELLNITQEISMIKQQIKEIGSLPTLKDEVKKLEDEKNIFQQQLQSTQNAFELKKAELKDVQEKKKKLDSRKNDIEKYTNSLNASYRYFEEDLSQIDNVTELSQIKDCNIDDLIERIKKNKKELLVQKDDKNHEFGNLKHKLYKEHADEKRFIEEVQEDFDTIHDKENTINKLVQSITDDISAPTATFLQELDYFENYIKSLSSTFKQYRISDLKSIELLLRKNDKIIKELKLIANIRSDRLFNVENESLSGDEQLEILKKYIFEAKTFTLSDLFDVAFKVNGEEVNLSKQVESTGTNRMLKILLFLLIMKDIIVQDENNKLVLYIDELGEVDDDNSLELIKRCKENNFLPIFAGPDKKQNIDKYYDLLKLKDSGKVIVDDMRALYAKDRV